MAIDPKVRSLLASAGFVIDEDTEIRLTHEKDQHAAVVEELIELQHQLNHATDPGKKTLMTIDLFNRITALGNDPQTLQKLLISSVQASASMRCLTNAIEALADATDDAEGPQRG